MRFKVKFVAGVTKEGTNADVSPTLRYTEGANFVSPFVPHRKHYVSATEPNRLMLFRETVAAYCENHTEHANTLCGQNAEFWYIKAGDTCKYSDH
jgi:hypothetical protein